MMQSLCRKNNGWEVIVTSHKILSFLVESSHHSGTMDTGDIIAAALIKWEPHLHCRSKDQNCPHLQIHKNTLFHVQFFILSLFYFTQHNNTVHVVFFCTEAFRELVTNTGYSIPMSVKSSQGFFFFLFFFFMFLFLFFQFFPLKNINFIRGTLKSSSVAFSSQFVSVYMSRNICTPQ